MDLTALNKFKCPVCGERFRTVSKLRSHTMLHDEQRLYKCEHCKKLFSKSSNLSSHIRTHTGEKPFQCKVCLKYFPRMNNLRSHITKMHKIKRAETDLYIKNEGRDVVSPPETESELGSDKEDTSDTDKELVAETDEFTVHVVEPYEYLKDVKPENYAMMEALGKRYCYTCKTCKKIMYHRSNMIDHVRCHSGLKLFKCGLCQKGLSRKQNVVHHLRYVHFIDSDKVDKMIVKEKSYVMKGETNSETREMHITDPEQCINDILQGKIQKPTLGEAGTTNEPGTNCTQKTIDVDMICSSLFGNKSTEGDLPKLNPTEPIGGDLSYMILFPNDPELRTYQCKFCDFQCKEESHMTEEHAPTHVDPHSYQCAICCNYFSCQAELRGHLTVSHSLTGKELEEVMELTGSRVPVIPGNTDSIKGLQKGKTGKVTRKSKLFKTSSLENEVNENNIKKGRKTGLDIKEVNTQRTEESERSNKQSRDSVNSNKSSCETTTNRNGDDTSLHRDFSNDRSKLSTGNGVDIKMRNETRADILTHNFNMIDANSGLPDMNSDLLNFNSSLFDMNPAPMDMKSALFDKKSDMLDMNSAPADMNYTPADMNSAPVDMNSAPVDMNSAPVDMNSAHADMNSAPVDINSAQADMNSVQADMNSAPMGMNSSPLNKNYWFKEQNASMSPTSEMLAKVEQDGIISNYMDADNLTCKKCRKKCSNKSNLKQHVRFVHLNLKDFTCVTCNKKFNTKFNLKVHWRQHGELADNTIEYRCKICGKYFSSQTYLESHLVKKHSGFGTSMVNDTDS